MIYICKCGKSFSKSGNAATTGFRETENCFGCPYLLHYGKNYFDDVQRAFVLDIKGYECRASQFLRYQTELSGALDDKTTIRIESLDFDFLERVSDWVKEHYPDGELSGSFSREKIRSAEYTSDGRYRYSLSCSQNKKGIAAKRALWAEFFDETYHRTDMSAEEEKDKILKDIQLGIERAKEAALMHYKDKNTGWVYRVSPQPGERDLYFIEYLDPASSVIFKRLPDYLGSRFRESVEEALTVLAQRNGWAQTEPPEIDPAGSDLSDVEEEETNVCCCSRCQKSDCVCAGTCDAQARALCDGRKNCSQASCTYSMKRECDLICKNTPAPTGDAAVTTTENAVKLLAGAEETPTISESAVDASTLTGLNEKEIPEMSAATAADAEPAASPAPLASDSMTEATAAGDCVATENVEGVTAVSLPDGKDVNIPAGFEEGIAAFDYKGLDSSTAQTVRANSDEFARHMLSSAEEYANACINAANVNKALSNHYHGKWGEWCAGFGLSNGAARRMVNIGRKLLSETKLVQLVSDGQIGKSLLQVVCSPNAPAELVQAVEDREITTHKQFKELEAQLKETQERAKRAEREAQEAKEKAHRLETRPVLSELYNANQRIKELENRPIEVATQAPTEEQINAAAEPVIQEMTAMYKIQQEQQREQIRELKAIVAASRNAIPNACRAIAESCAEAFARGFEEFQTMAQDLSDDEYMNAVEPIFEACREILDSLEGADYVEG